MLPTLKPGQDVLTFNWWKLLGIKEGDLVVVKVNNIEIIKRVHNISDREYFVEGDNKNESSDSRNFGPINKDQIMGKVVWFVR